MAILSDRTELTTPADGDLYVTTDVSDTTDAGTGTDKKITWANLKAGFKAYFDTLYAGVLGADDNYVTDAEKSALHTHSNKTVLDNTTASFVTAQETKLGHISVSQAVNLDTMESDIATNNAKVTNATHTGEVTGSGALTLDKTAITGKSAVTAVGTDYVLLSDTSDTGNLKKALVSDFGTGAVEGTAVLSTGEVGGTKFLREDGDGTCSWQTPSGGGDVSKVGTPVDNQVGVWTGDGTIEGDAGLTWDGGMGITVSDTENKVGLAISQLDATNDKLALEVNGKVANGTVAKVTPATLVQFNDTDGANSDWSFNVAGSGFPTINLQATGGTLTSPTALASPRIVSTIDTYFYNSTNTQKQGSFIETYLIDNTNGSEDSRIGFGVITAGTLNSELELTGASLYPKTNDGLALGDTTHQYSDLFLAEGGVINWDNGDATLTQSGNVVTLAGADLTVPNMTVGAAGAITLSENASIALDPAGSADGKYTGITVTGTGGATIAFGDLVTLDKDDSRWELVDISVAAAATGDARGILGMAVTSSSDGAALTVLLNGIIRADANFPALTIGAPVYASTTGDVVVTQPTTTDYVIRQVGYALTADELYFNPTGTWTTHT